MAAKVNIAIGEEWVTFVEDFTANLLNPQMNSGGSYFTHATLNIVYNYGVAGAVVSIVRDHGPLTFSSGLPVLPHDFGYVIFSVTVTATEVVGLIVVPPKQKLRNVGKKTAALERRVKIGLMPTLAMFGLPVKWRFEGGKS